MEFTYKMDMKQSKNWCFTDFNLLNWGEIFETHEIAYVCFGLETCPETGREHYQGWMQFHKKKRRTWIMKNISKMWCSPCLGSEYKNEKYTQKDNEFKTYGQFTIQGKDSNINDVFERIEQGDDSSTIISENPGIYCRHRNGIRDYMAICQEKKVPAWRDVKVIVYCGHTGTGKTRKAMASEEDIFKIQGDDLKWWDGYEGNSTICIDEYDTDIAITKLLSLLDGYKIRLEIKGGHTWANWTTVYITSNVHFTEWHPQAKGAHRAALLRRLSECWYFGADGSIKLVFGKCAEEKCAEVGSR
ncbi:MAG: replication-associated protein [Circoviridae sp.]|nr:MAG: replication-associated protein [Circoviridae sp.]